MTLTGELDEPEERTCELRIMHILLTRRTFRADPETCTRTWNILFVVLLQNILVLLVLVGDFDNDSGEQAHSNKVYGIDDDITCVWFICGEFSGKVFWKGKTKSIYLKFRIRMRMGRCQSNNTQRIR